MDDETYDLQGLDKLDVIIIRDFLREKLENEHDFKREYVDEYDSFQVNYNDMIQHYDKRIKHLKELVEKINSDNPWLEDLHTNLN